MAALNILICSHDHFQRSTLVSQLGHLGYYQPRLWGEASDRLEPSRAICHDLLLVDPATLPALLQRTTGTLHARTLLCVDAPDERQQALLARLLTATGAHYLGALPLTLGKATRQVVLARHLEILEALHGASAPAMDDPLDDLHCRPFYGASGSLRYLALEPLQPEAVMAAHSAARAPSTEISMATVLAATYRLAALLEQRWGARPGLLLEIPMGTLAASDFIDALLQGPPGCRSRLILSLRDLGGSPSLPEPPLLSALAETGIGLALPDYDLCCDPLLHLSQQPPRSLLLSPHFTQGLAHDPRRRVIAIQLQSLAQRCGGTLLAANVEQRSDLDFLRRELACPSHSDRLVQPFNTSQLLECWASLATLATDS
ncbi:hypothetical protein [Pseudomonas oryzihabitans]|uniref:EAL domain-containing protein n=1 Tax=Pseudomonas oryzihabitans TaxID=47885 RepID=A0AAJ2BKX3_9PSED|nr:hypothetical protein [Pseudomonas psychrotolerans]MDR6232389.1 hypothetical protein [Pseudomonas psychrotolerans]MDR6353387.1 hypothetical protein [Pseudomonas psychrotolerans]MDR6680380.1 hypothetical protein [Pseudomonas psychrotolerans]